MAVTGHTSRAAAVVESLGRACARRRILVLSAWILLVTALVTGARVFGTPTDNDVSLPGTDAQVVRDLTAASPNSGAAPASSGWVIVVAPAGTRLDDPAHTAALTSTASALRGQAHVVSVTPPQAQAGSLSADGRTGWFTVALDVPRGSVTAAQADAATKAAASLAAAGMRVLPGGAFAQAADGSGTHNTEYIGLALAAVVLTVTLGGLLGAVIPLVAAGLALVATLDTIGLAGNVTSIPSTAATLATMVGLGVGIDYALFLLSRYRDLARTGLTVDDAIGRAAGDSGTAVAFAAVTVAVALAGLALTGVPILATLAWTAAVAVAFAVLAALTLLPALTSLAGERLVRGGRLLARFRRPLAGPAGGPATGQTPSFWERQAARVTRRPWLAGGAALAALALLAAPAADLRLGQQDAGSSPPSTAVRQANDVVSAAFGPGRGSPVTVLALLASPAAGPTDPQVTALLTRIQAEPGVASAGGAAVSPDGRQVTVTAVPATAGSDPATTRLVHRLRQITLPGMTIHVGGTTAARADLADRVTSRLGLVISVVLLLSMVVLLLAFRAPLVAVKAAAMDLISIGAAFGALTAVFTWGWGVNWLGLSGPVPIQSYVPLMLFALLFGLSMDYEVFLLSAVRRSWTATGDNLRAVREGLATTGGVITAAATIMAGVFIAFIPHDDPTIKMFGVGMTVAIVVDATIVRGLLVPATMALLGNLTWWVPRRGPGGTPLPAPAPRERRPV